MLKFMLIGFCFGVILHGECTNKHRKALRTDFEMLAWNEDTVYPSYIKFFRNASFIYIITDTNGRHAAEGKAHYVNDTFHLDFSRMPAPNMMRDFLITEATGQYLIQLSSGKCPRLVLRIWPHNHYLPNIPSKMMRSTNS